MLVSNLWMSLIVFLSHIVCFYLNISKNLNFLLMTLKITDHYFKKCFQINLFRNSNKYLKYICQKCFFSAKRETENVQKSKTWLKNTETEMTNIKIIVCINCIAIVFLNDLNLNKMIIMWLLSMLVSLCQLQCVLSCYLISSLESHCILCSSALPLLITGISRAV